MKCYLVWHGGLRLTGYKGELPTDWWLDYQDGNMYYMVEWEDDE